MQCLTWVILSQVPSSFPAASSGLGCARASALVATALLESRICLHKKPHFSVQPLCMNLHAFCEASGKSRHLNWGWGVWGGIADFQVWKGWDESFLCSAVLPRHQLLFGYGRHVVFKRKKNISTGLFGEPAAGFLGAEVGPYCREFSKGNIIKTRLK